MFSATDVDPSPGVPHANGAAYRRISAQVKTRRPTAGCCTAAASSVTRVSAATGSVDVCFRFCAHRRYHGPRVAPK